MKLFYLANDIYDINNLKKKVDDINKEVNKNESEKKIVVYGGNLIKNNKFNINDESYNNYLSTFAYLNINLDKFILFGGFDFKNKDYFNKYVNINKQNNNFTNIFDIDYKLIDDSSTLLIFLNNQLDLIESTEIIKIFTRENSTEFNDCMTINDLIEKQIEKLRNILIKNININTIIFFTQTPLFILDYENLKLKISESLGISNIFEWINRYFYILNDLKLYWFCSDFKSRNEISTINIVKKDLNNNEISTMTIRQYIHGTQISDVEKIDIEEYVNKSGNKINGEFEILISDFNDLGEKISFEVEYSIDNINSSLNFLEYEIYKSQNNINDLINDNELIDKDDIKIEEKMSNENIGIDKIDEKYLNKNILDNIELLSEKSDDSQNTQITLEGDPYKKKYLKYKKKLYKLRNK